MDCKNATKRFRSKEHGEVMLEGMIVVIITIFMLLWIFGVGSSREFRVSKMAMQEDFVGSADALYPVQKPLPVSITVDYVFTLLSTFR